MKTTTFKSIALTAVAAMLLSACNKNEAGKGEKEEGIYYNERTDKNGSSDTTATSHDGAIGSPGQNIGNTTDSTTVDGPKGTMSNN